MIKRAKKHYFQAKQEITDPERKVLLPAEIMGHTYFKILSKIEKKPYLPLKQEIRLSSFEVLVSLLQSLIRNKLKLKIKL